MSGVGPSHVPEIEGDHQERGEERLETPLRARKRYCKEIVFSREDEGPVVQMFSPLD
jgi:hypothetical protein